jgi:monovalent cation:H+ antiporter-2, CPA2 family
MARKLNPRIAILATAESEAERAWLNEFGVQFVSSIHDEMSDALLRAVRRVL